jgi:hypothetical protein
VSYLTTENVFDQHLDDDSFTNPRSSAERRLDNSITTSDDNGCHSYTDNAVKMKKNIVV